MGKPDSEPLHPRLGLVARVRNRRATSVEPYPGRQGLTHLVRLEPQPVRSRLGERFLPWQLEQSVEESWEECRRHAALIERIVGPLPGAEPAPAAPRKSRKRRGASGNGIADGTRQLDLFGDAG